MQRMLLTLLMMLLLQQLNAQSDFLIHKKRRKTVNIYFPGSYITFQTYNKQWVTGQIKNIRNDSIILKLLNIRMYGGAGIAIADTGYAGLMFLHKNDILAFEKDRAFGFIGNGKLFQIGAAGYAGLNIANGLVYNQPLFDHQNKKRLGVAAGVFMLGKILQWTYSPVLKIGKKHQLLYIPFPKDSVQARR